MNKRSEIETQTLIWKCLVFRLLMAIYPGWLPQEADSDMEISKHEDFRECSENDGHLRK